MSSVVTVFSASDWDGDTESSSAETALVGRHDTSRKRTQENRGSSPEAEQRQSCRGMQQHWERQKRKCESGCAYHGITDSVTNTLMKVQHVAVSENSVTTTVSRVW